MTEGSANRRIFGATVTVLVMTVAVKGVTLVKEVLVAARFGTADELDAFLIAFLLPSLVINILGATLGAVFIPTYVAIRESRGVAHALDGDQHRARPDGRNERCRGSAHGLGR